MPCTRLSLAAIGCVLSFAANARAQPQPQPAPPAPPPPSADKGDAKQLMQTGVRLLEAHDYLGALEVFKSAYERFASAKILLNIGTTLKLLDRKCEAANAYQRYLGATDADPAKRPEVTEALADLDKSCGQLDLTIDPADAELEVGNEHVLAAQAKAMRLAPGPFSVRAKREGFQPGEQSGKVDVGQHVAVSIKLAANVTQQTTLLPVEQQIGGRSEVPLETTPEAPRSRLAGVLETHISVAPRTGSAYLIGASYDINAHLAIEAELLLGPGLAYSQGSYMFGLVSVGGYAGASFAFLTGQWRPRVSAGLPIFDSGGVRVAVRGAGGVEWVANRHFSLIAELGAEVNLNPASDIDRAALVPAIAACGRL